MVWRECLAVGVAAEGGRQLALSCRQAGRGRLGFRCVVSEDAVGQQGRTRRAARALESQAHDVSRPALTIYGIAGAPPCARRPTHAHLPQV